MSNVTFGLQLELKGDKLVVRGLDGTRTAVSNLEREVSRNTQSSVAAAQTNRELTTSYSALSSQAKAFSGVLAAIGVYRIGGSAISDMGDFEYSIAGVKAVTGATRDQLDEMTAVAKKLGSTTKFSASQAAEGMRFLGMAGFETNEIILAMPAALNLAAAAGLDLGSAADITSNIMSAFNVEASRTSEIADALAVAAANANTDISQMGEAMKYVGPVAAALDISMQDSAAAIGALSNAGIQGSSAGTGLRRVLSGLANPTKEAAALIRGMGLSVDELNPKTHTITELVTKLKDANLSAADALTIFGDRGGPAILALTEQIPGLQKLTGAINDSEGAAQRMAETLSDNLKGDWLEFLSSVESVFLAIGDAGALDGLRTRTQDATAVVRYLGENLDTVGDVALILSGLIGGKLVSALVSATAAVHAKDLANLKLVTSELALAKSAHQRAIQEQLAAKRSLVVAGNDTLRAAAITRLAAANTRVVATQSAVNAATAAYAGVATVAGAAARGLNLALGFVGGPVGLATLAAVAIYSLQDNLGLVSAPAKLATSNINKLSASLQGLGEAQLEQTLASMTAHLVELQEISAKADEAAKESLENQTALNRLNPWNDTIDVIKKATTATSEVGDQMKRLGVVEEALYNLRNKDKSKPGGLDDESLKAIDDATQKLLDQTKIITEQNELLRLGYTLEDAKFIAAYANADLTTQALMRQQREQKGIIDGYQEEIDILGYVEDAQEKASEKAMALAKANEGAMDAFLNASIGDGLVEGFDDASKALATFVDGFGELISAQELYNKALKDPKADEESKGKAAVKYQQAQVGLYGDMAASSKQYFDEGSKGYKALQAAEQTFRAIELALAAKSAIAKGVNAVLTQAEGDPYTAFARMAAMAAAVATLGVAIGGIGGGSSGVSYTPQDTYNSAIAGVSGTVLGSEEASESISASIGILADLSDSQLGYTVQMAQSLRNIEASFVGYSGAASGIDGFFRGTNFGSVTEGLGTNPDTPNLVSSFVTPTVGDVELGVLIDRMAAQNKRQSDASGDVYDPLMESLHKGDMALARLYTDSVRALVSGAESAIDSLGLSINSSISDIEIKPFDIDPRWDSEQIDTYVAAYFSALGDTIVGDVVPAIEDFRQGGEGLMETLTRVAGETFILRDAIGSLSLSLDGTPLELIAVADALGLAAGGLSEFSENVNDFLDFALSDSEQFDRVGKNAAALFDGLSESLPESRDGVIDFIRALDLTSAAGQQAFTSITNASDLLEDYYSQLEDFAESAYSFDTDLGIADGMQPLRDALAAVGLNIDIVETAAKGGIEALQALFVGLTDVQKAGLEPFTDELLGMVDSVDELAAAAQRLRDFAIGASNALLSPEKQLAASQADYQQLINSIVNGDLSRVNDVVNVGQSVISQAANTAETELDYKRIVASVSSAAYSVADLIDPRSAIDIAGEQLDVLKDIRTQLSGGAIAIPQSQIDTSGAARITIGSDPELLGVMRRVDEKLAQLLNDQRAGHSAIASNTGRVAKLFDRWDDGDALLVREYS